METQLRVYTVAEGAFDAWLAEWREHVAPLRERFGFRVLGPWADLATNTFVWMLEYDGPDDFAAADSRYYGSPERQALEPDPARHLTSVETRMLRPVEPTKPRN
jgi:NIPSNAP